jgi:serine/threonine protein kinase
MIIKFADKGNLKSNLSKNFSDMWENKINLLHQSSYDLQNFHKLGYFHRDFHNGNILQDHNLYFISDYGLSGLVNEHNKVFAYFGVMSYIAPEVLNGEQYTSSSDT